MSVIASSNRRSSPMKKVTEIGRIDVFMWMYDLLGSLISALNVDCDRWTLVRK